MTFYTKELVQCLLLVWFKVSLSNSHILKKDMSVSLWKCSLCLLHVSIH